MPPLAPDRTPTLRPAMGRRAVRAFVVLHQYLGTAFCLVFLAWFASGIVMMYAGYPLLSEADKLARMPRLDTSLVRLSPAEAWGRAQQEGAPADVRLGMLGRRPVYRFATSTWDWVTVGADDGRVMALDVEAAGRLVEAFAPGAPRLEHLGHLDSPDQWTIFSLWAPYMAGQKFSPVHKFARNDAAGTQVYVLAATGDIVQATTRSERVWGYLGPVVHWVYPTRLRAAHPDAWNDVVVWLSFVGMAICGSGLILGVYRWRRGSLARASPFRGWMRWHHYLGLAFGLFATTWVFSGLLSMDPWSWSQTDDTPDGSHQTVMRGGDLGLGSLTLAPAEAVAICNREIATKELRMAQLRGSPYYWCVETPARSRLLDARAGGEPVAMMSKDTLVAAARALMPNTALRASDWLTDYDDYYYPGWYDKVVRGGAKRLPVLRLTFDDPGRTLVYVDPYSAAPILAYDASGRWYRWLFHGLHSLDIGPLYRWRPVWDMLVLPLMLGGVLLSATGLWIGVRWLTRTLRFASRDYRRAPSPR